MLVDEPITSDCLLFNLPLSNTCQVADIGYKVDDIVSAPSCLPMMFGALPQLSFVLPTPYKRAQRHLVFRFWNNERENWIKYKPSQRLWPSFRASSLTSNKIEYNTIQHNTIRYNTTQDWRRPCPLNWILVSSLVWWVCSAMQCIRHQSHVYC